MIAPQALYTIPELADLVGISRWRLRRLLERADIEMHRSGRIRVVYLSSISQALPELWQSIVARREIDPDFEG
jgi:hypothetical protein